MVLQLILIRVMFQPPLLSSYSFARYSNKAVITAQTVMISTSHMQDKYTIVERSVKHIFRVPTLNRTIILREIMEIFITKISGNLLW